MTFGEWCKENNKEWILDMAANADNECNVADMSYGCNDKVWFWCGDPNHKPFYSVLNSIHLRRQDLLVPELFCPGCKSFGQEIINLFGEDILEQIWSTKNEKNPFDISWCSRDSVWLKCLEDEFHDEYLTRVASVHKTHSLSCPYCGGVKLAINNTLGYLYPEVYEIWSDLNETLPTDYSKKSGQNAWFKCRNGIHDDFYRRIAHEVDSGFNCPRCANIEKALRGPDNPRYKPTRDEEMRIRNSHAYKQWRNAIVEYDGYTCQACGAFGVKLNAHHIYSFASYPDIRLSLDNGITLCEECHSNKYKGSLHDVYGIHDVTPEQLEEYINSRRQAFGITELFSATEYINEKRNEVNTA